jgi:pimeloyl-ACP methyl ester carboxylesterase
MYDAAGCGRSPNPHSYSASTSSSSPYSDEEQVLDLEAFLHKFVRKKIEKDQPHQRHHQQQDRQKTQCRIFFIGHSYGPNWIYKFMIYEQKKESEQRRNYHLRKQTEASPSLSLLFQIEGLVLISTGVGDSTLLVKGGPPIFRYCPVFVLRCVQPILTEFFLRMGFAKNTHATKPLLVQVARRSNNQNDMSTICHYYRSHDWISEDDLRDFYEQFVAPARQTSDDITPQGDDDDSIIRSKKRVRVLVLHGDEDQIIPIEKGQIVANILMTKDIYKAQKNSCNIGENIIDSTENDSDNDALLVISDASHSIMQEQAVMLSKHILQFIGIRDIQI